MNNRPDLQPGDLVAFDELMLVRSAEVLAVAGVMLAEQIVQPMVCATFHGRQNKGTEDLTYSIGMDPDDAIHTAQLLMQAALAAKAAGRKEGWG